MATDSCFEEANHPRALGVLPRGLILRAPFWGPDPSCCAKNCDPPTQQRMRPPSPLALAIDVPCVAMLPAPPACDHAFAWRQLGLKPKAAIGGRDGAPHTERQALSALEMIAQALVQTASAPNKNAMEILGPTCSSNICGMPAPEGGHEREKERRQSCQPETNTKEEPVAARSRGMASLPNENTESKGVARGAAPVQHNVTPSTAAARYHYNPNSVQHDTVSQDECQTQHGAEQSTGQHQHPQREQAS